MQRDSGGVARPRQLSLRFCGRPRPCASLLSSFSLLSVVRVQITHRKALKMSRVSEEWQNKSRLPPPLFGLLLSKSFFCLCWSLLLFLSMKDTTGTFHSSRSVPRSLLDKCDLLQGFAPSQLPLCRRLGLAGEDHVKELPLELRPLWTPPIHPDDLVAFTHRALE